jgi:hypothetical protein
MEGMQWLGKYALSPTEISRNRIGWSPNGWMIRKGTITYSPLMIFPVFDPFGNLTMFQARYFGSEPKLPKYWTMGNKNVLHIMETSTKTICLSEDLISAIKLSRHVSAMPIFGSDISTEMIIQLHNRFANLIIWLDKDKRKYAHARGLSVRYLFDSVKVVDSEADPKDYNDADMRRYLGVQ